MNAHTGKTREQIIAGADNFAQQVMDSLRKNGPSTFSALSDRIGFASTRANRAKLNRLMQTGQVLSYWEESTGTGRGVAMYAIGTSKIKPQFARDKFALPIEFFGSVRK